MGSIPIRFRQESVGAAESVAYRTRSKKRKSKRKKTFTAETEARRQARELIGTPPPTRVLPDRRRKPPKHKKELIEKELPG